MLRLKDYQQRALDALSRYFRTCSELRAPGTAFYHVTADLFGQGIPYNSIDELPGPPYVCLRMPTGAGKTYVACHAVGTATKELLEADRSVVLWLVPTTRILEQTLAALKDGDHPYRQAVAAAAGSVTVMSVAEALHVNRATMDTETVVIVSTMQSFRIDDTEGRKVYDDDGGLMDHFNGLPDQTLDGLERREDGSLIHSLANVLRVRRPIVIVDEAHNARTELSFKTLGRFAPSCIIELTATPDTEKNPSNVLYTVSAAELKAEEMIKLPLELTTKGDWKELLSDAVACRDRLERTARAEHDATGEYIRPILLLQAEPNYSDRDSLSIDVVRDTLIRDFRIDADEVALATGASDDLEGVDLSDRDCPLRYIITVQKLKEGWDCPFAYVLCSVAELRSTVAIEQLVGRVLRLPNARRKRHEALNRAYAFSASPHFAGALNALKDVLVENGFQRQEVDTLVRRAAAHREEGADTAEELFEMPGVSVSVEITAAEAPDLNELPEETARKASFVAETGTLVFRGVMTAPDRDALKRAYQSAESRVAVEEAYRRSRTEAGVKVPAPVERGETLAVPKLLIRQGELFEEFEKTHILERPWRLSECDATLPGFRIDPDTSRRGVVDVNRKGRLETRFIDALHTQITLLANEHGWSVARLVGWLDRAFPHPDIPPDETGIFLTRLVEHLIDDRGFTLDQLVHHKYALKKAVERRIDEHRKAAHERTFQTLLELDGTESALAVDPDVCFSFSEHYPYSSLYEGTHEFPKHFYRVVGAMNGEEEQCALYLEGLSEVECWVRNLERRPRHAFWLQTSSDRFYPDFVCKLRDGRILVVEYKAENDWSNADSREKRALGELWAERSEGHCLFSMPRGAEFDKIRERIEQ